MMMEVDWVRMVLKFWIFFVVAFVVLVWIVGSGQVTPGKFIVSIFIALFCAFFKPEYK